MCQGFFSRIKKYLTNIFKDHIMLRLLLNAVLFFEIFTFLRKISEEKTDEPTPIDEDIQDERDKC